MAFDKLRLSGCWNAGFRLMSANDPMADASSKQRSAARGLPKHLWLRGVGERLRMMKVTAILLALASGLFVSCERPSVDFDSLPGKEIDPSDHLGCYFLNGVYHLRLERLRIVNEDGSDVAVMGFRSVRRVPVVLLESEVIVNPGQAGFVVGRSIEGFSYKLLEVDGKQYLRFYDERKRLHDLVRLPCQRVDRASD